MKIYFTIGFGGFHKCSAQEQNGSLNWQNSGDKGTIIPWKWPSGVHAAVHAFTIPPTPAKKQRSYPKNDPPHSKIAKGQNWWLKASMTIAERFSQRGSTEQMSEMWLFWCGPCLMNIHLLNVPQSLGSIGPPQWSGWDFRSNFNTGFSHFRPPLPNQSLFSSQHKMATLTFWYRIILGFKE